MGSTPELGALPTGTPDTHPMSLLSVVYRAERAPHGWKASYSTVSGAYDTGYEPLSESAEEVDIDARKRAWARLLAKVYEVDPMTCPECGADMKVIAIIKDPHELKRILRHPGCRAEQQPQAATRLINIGRSPPGFDPDRLKSRGVPERSEERTRH